MLDNCTAISTREAWKLPRAFRVLFFRKNMDPVILNALNEQVNQERFNQAAYLALAYSLEAVNWTGAAAWMHKASGEEGEHADKFAGHIIDRGGNPMISALPGPVQVIGEDLVPFFEAALQLERENTERIIQLKLMAEEYEDVQLCTFLIWAVDEQTAAERELQDILLTLRRLDNNGRQVFDEQLGD